MSSRRKILLVDDSPIVRAIAVHALSTAGFDVATIEDPRALDEALVRDRPDLVLVDATFPNVTDDDLIAVVSKHAASFALVFFSDRREEEVRALVARSGARGFVPKEGMTLADRLGPFLEM